MKPVRIGFGYDVHRMQTDRELIIGGVTIPHEKGLAGHSDADVLLHAICDALLGAVALGDIGKNFPDSDPQYKNVDSRKLLRHSYKLVNEKGYILGNLDSTIVAQAPKLQPFIQDMRKNIASDLDCEVEVISVKATTSEQLGFEGRKEGISASVVVLVQKKE